MIIHDVGLEFRGPSPNGGKQKVIDTVLYHHRDGYGDIESLHKMHFDKGWWGIGYHYYIRRDGSAYRGRPEEFVGSHAGSKNDYNEHSLGLCFEGRFEQEPPTAEQIKTGQLLTADIESRHPIKYKKGHKDVTATACPGKNFPIDKMSELSEQTKYTVCLGEYDTKAEAVAVARLLEKWFDTAQVNII